MELNDLYEAGSDIMDAVSDAVSRNDYSHLSDDIRKTVDELRVQIRREMPDGDVRRGSGRYAYRRPAANNNVYRSRQTAGSRKADEKFQERYAEKISHFLRKKISRQAGTGKIVLGVIGAMIGIPMLLFGAIPALFSLSIADLLVNLLIGGGITAASLWAIFNGREEKALANRYYVYGKAVGSAEYIELSKLAARVGRKTEDVREDIKKMMEKGFLPLAWLDEQETTLILTEDAYRQYQQLREQMAQRAAEEQAQEAEQGSMPQEARKILEDGAEYIRSIRRYNEDIPGKEMSDKLDRLESTMNRILEQVRKNPESAPELRKLMSYYLPTTVKLLEAYRELDRQSGKGENIVNTKREIEDALDTINDAFENLLDSLFQDMAWDISTDISVMETMLRQDGLTAQEMRAGKRRAANTAPGSGQAAEAPGMGTAQAAGAFDMGAAAETAEAEQGEVKVQAGASTLVFGEGGVQYQTDPNK